MSPGSDWGSAGALALLMALAVLETAAVMGLPLREGSPALEAWRLRSPGATRRDCPARFTRAGRLPPRASFELAGLDWTVRYCEWVSMVHPG